jgi:hypothetical protein
VSPTSPPAAMTTSDDAVVGSNKVVGIPVVGQAAQARSARAPVDGAAAGGASIVGMFCS